MVKRPRGPPPAVGCEGQTVLSDGAIVDFIRRPFTASAAGALTDALRTEVAWTQRQVKVYGKTHNEPRLQCYQAEDPSLRYKYSGLTIDPVPFSPCVLQIRERLRELFPASPCWNTCLLNRYRDGNDNMGWHSDEDIPRYGEDPHICSVSFGAERVFRLRRNSDHSEQVDFTLGGGAVLLMHGKTQKFWQHSLPKKSGALERVNLTFRFMRTVVA